MSSSHDRVGPLPWARRDPISDHAQALALVRAAIHRPPRHETILVLLDEKRCGHGLVVVAGTEDPDAAITVVDRLAPPAARAGVAAMIVASVRPVRVAGGRDPVSRDPDRFVEMSATAEAVGVTLVEWFVVGPTTVSCPRDELFEAPRWSRW